MEVFYNTKNQVPFEIYLTEEERQAFQERLSRDPVEVLKSFSRISTRASTCWVINDQNRIHGLIEGSVGFDRMDQVVRDAIAVALKVGAKTQNVGLSTATAEQITIIDRSASSDYLDGNKDAEILALKRENLELKEKIFRLNSMLAAAAKKVAEKEG